MINIVMLTKDRPKLLTQCLLSLLTCTESPFNLTLLDDGSSPENVLKMETLLHSFPSARILRHQVSTRNTALNRNLGVYYSEHFFGRGDWLYLSDNDAKFTAGWDLKCIESLRADMRFRVIGPYRHPYHLPNETVKVENWEVAATDAVQGIGHMMHWYTWGKYGPLDEHPGEGRGTNQSEDYAFCQRIVKDGFMVGSVQPNVVLNCGLTDSQGKPCVGYEQIVNEKVEGVYYE